MSVVGECLVAFIFGAIVGSLVQLEIEKRSKMITEAETISMANQLRR